MLAPAAPRQHPGRRGRLRGRGDTARDDRSVAELEGDRVVGVRARDKQGRAQTIRAAVTVGADGVGSTIATRIDAPVVWRARSAGAVLSATTPSCRPWATSGLTATGAAAA